MTKTNASQDIQAATLGGDLAGATGTNSANLSGSGSVTLTDSGKSFTSNTYVGHHVTAVDRTTHTVYKGIIASNTSTTFTVFAWETPGTDSAVTPTTTNTFDYCILSGQAPSWIMALSSSTASVGSGDTTLVATEFTLNGLAAVRGTYAHTASASTYSLSSTWTCSGGSNTVGKLGVRQSTVTTNNCLFQTLLSSTVTLGNTDQLTVTDTVTM